MTFSPKQLFEYISLKLASIMAESEQWTQIEKGLFNALRELGEKEGYSVYVRGVGEGEWLVDLCWYYDKGTMRKWIELACEIEWSSQDRHDIVNDMCKLMDVKSYLKLGISSPKLKDKDDVISDVARLMKDHAIKLPVEQYLMLYMIYQPYVKKEEKFNVLAYSYDALGNEVFLGEKKVAW